MMSPQRASLFVAGVITAALIIGPSTLTATALAAGSAVPAGATNAAGARPQMAPHSVALAGTGRLLIADGATNVVWLKNLTHYTIALFGQTIPAGHTMRVAGNGTCGSGGDGGVGVNAQLNQPAALALDTTGNLYIADSGNNRVREVTVGGIITTVAGTGVYGYGGDGGAATAAMLAAPAGLTVSRSGTLYIADSGNNRVRAVTLGTGMITTVAGSGAYGYGGDGGPATAAALAMPLGLALDRAGNLFIADSLNNRIREVTMATGIITTVAGNGTGGPGGDGGVATKAQLAAPSGVAIDKTGNLIIADANNNRVRVVSAATGIITTVAGNGIPGYAGDGGAATAAELYGPSTVTVDSLGNLFINDFYNRCVRMVLASTGIIRTVAG